MANTTSTRFYSTRQAAKECRMALSTFKRHIYKYAALEPDGKIGTDLYFSQETIDKFRATLPRRRKKGKKQ